MELRSERYFRPAVAEAEARNRTAIEALLPAAEVEHIGSTAVAGVVTKGDMDLLVRVPAAEFAAACGALRGRYDVNQPENWARGFASFTEPDPPGIPVGIQLVAAGDEWDRRFVEWRRLLTVDPAVRARYNQLKRNHADSGPDAYLEAKNRFIADELGVPPAR